MSKSLSVNRTNAPGYHPVGDGLVLYVRPSGKKVWLFRYRRPENGKPAKLTLGPALGAAEQTQGKPELGKPLTLKDARALVTAAKAAKQHGVDAGREYHQAKTESRALRGDTFEWACREFVINHARRKNRRWRDTAIMLGLNVDKKTDQLAEDLRPSSLARRWRDVPVAQITRRQINAILDEYVRRDSPYAALSMLSCLRKMFRWLVARGVLKESPCQGVERPHTPVARDHVLTDPELVAFWRACHTLSEPFGPLFRLLLVTGQRRDEVGDMVRSELLGDLWTIAALRMKNKREHVVPLTRLALGIIEGVTRKGQSLIFTTTGKTPVSGWSRAKTQLDRLMQQELGDVVMLSEWRLHDLRRTVSTRMNGLKIAPHVVEAVLSHTVKGVAGVYNRHTYLDEKRNAFEAWSRLLLSIVEPGTVETNVVPLRAEASL